LVLAGAGRVGSVPLIFAIESGVAVLPTGLAEAASVWGRHPKVQGTGMKTAVVERVASSAEILVDRRKNDVEGVASSAEILVVEGVASSAEILDVGRDPASGRVFERLIMPVD